MEIKNLAYNLAKLQQNTLTYRRNHPGHSTQTTTQANQTRFNPYFTTHRIPNSSTPITLKPSQIDILPTPTQNYFNQTNTKPTRSLESEEVGEGRGEQKDCFWCDEKFITGHRCKNKKRYSSCILDGEEKSGEEVVHEQELARF